MLLITAVSQYRWLSATYTNADVMLAFVRTGLMSAYVSSRDNCTFTTHTHVYTH